MGSCDWLSRRQAISLPLTSVRPEPLFVKRLLGAECQFGRQTEEIIIIWAPAFEVRTYAHTQPFENTDPLVIFGMPENSLE